MSESGNYSSRSGHDIASNLSSDLEEDYPGNPVPVTSQAHGNFLSCHQTNIGQNYSERHPLVTGHSSFNRPTVSVFRKPNDDIVPEISNIYDGYKSEAKRLETFYDWPSNMVVKKEDLARNGFIYLHVNDRAQCVFCRGVLSSWEPGDVVENEHKQHCPECPFAFGYECGNIPSPGSSVILQRQSANSNPQRPQPQSFNTTVKVPVQAPQINSLNRPDSYASEPSSMGLGLPALPSGQYGQVQQNAAQVTTTEPKYRDWGDEYKRVMSFKGWPTQMSQTPIELAKAGLLYMGNGDRCKCFWCGGELYDWELQDTPWEEHAKWFPHCGFVRAMKGDAYIQYVKNKQNGAIESPPIHESLRTPHVLSVLQEGYTQDQVMEAFNRFGQQTLTNARSIKQAIEQNKRDREAMVRESHRVAGTQETSSSVTLPDEDEEMDVEENQGPTQGQSTGNRNNDNKTSPRTSNLSATSSSSANSKDVESVMQENEKLKDMKLCKICMDSELCMTFLPCGHLATCEDCAQSVQECPICRKPIQQRVKIFWA